MCFKDMCLHYTKHSWNITVGKKTPPGFKSMQKNRTKLTREGCVPSNGCSEKCSVPFAIREIQVRIRRCTEKMLEWVIFKITPGIHKSADSSFHGHNVLVTLENILAVPRVTWMRNAPTGSSISPLGLESGAVWEGGVCSLPGESSDLEAGPEAIWLDHSTAFSLLPVCVWKECNHLSSLSCFQVVPFWWTLSYEEL